MLLVVDALNKHKFKDILDDMFRLRARVFGDRMGWDVSIVDGMERDHFDDLDPCYGIGLDDDGNVVSCVRALQTTGPHMLSDVFSAILGGEPPLRSPEVWESTRFCVDTARLSRSMVSKATCELMIASLETARDAGVTDIVTVVDPVMNRVLKRSGNAPYDYLGSTVPMGKVSAMAALLDVTEERINAIRSYAGIDYDVFLTEDQGRALFDKSKAKPLATLPARADLGWSALLSEYCMDQISTAATPDERKKALALQTMLLR